MEWEELKEIDSEMLFKECEKFPSLMARCVMACDTTLRAFVTSGIKLEMEMLNFA
jgi:hypothetical protein